MALIEAGARFCLLGHGLAIAAALLTAFCVLATGRGDLGAVLRVAGASGIALGMPGVALLIVRDAVARV